MNVANEEWLYKLVGDNIREYRISANLRQSDLAAKIGISRTALTNIEQGRQNVSLYTFWKIAHSLGVGIHDLLPADSELQEDKVLPNKVSRIKEELNNDAYQSLVDFMNAVNAKSTKS